MEFKHAPVLLNEVIDGLKIKQAGIYVDCTLGGAGHSYEIASRLGENGRLIGIDQDGAAIEAATERLAPFGDKVTIVRSNYSKLGDILNAQAPEGVDGIIADLGVSSYQLDCAARGFGYRYDAPLDMRMDMRQELSAAEIINDYEERELFRVIRDYGEEPFAQNIAKHIVKARAEKRIATTFELNEIIKAAIPAKIRAKGGHPSKRTFQALRIECNKELEVLRDTIDEMMIRLKPGGRLCVITFHSLEDRIVKTAFRTAENPCTCPPSFPLCICGKKPIGKVVTKKPILPSGAEQEANPRSKSAKLRVFERV